MSSKDNSENLVVIKVEQNPVVLDIASRNQAYREKMAERDSFNIRIFDGTDYGVWKFQMEQIFEMKGLTTAITETEATIPPAQLEDFRKASKKAKTYIATHVDTKHAKNIMNCTTAKDMWDRLSQIHENTSKNNKIGLQREFFTFRMKNNESVSDYVSRGEYIFNKLKEAGVMYTEDTLVSKLICGLPNQFRTFRSQWNATTDKDQVLGVLVPRLMAEEQMNQETRGNDKNNDSVAMYSRNTYRNNRFRSNNNNDKFKQDESNNNKKTFIRRNMPIAEQKKFSTCHSCGQKGHWSGDPVCRKPQSNPRASTSNAYQNRPTRKPGTKDGQSAFAEALLTKSK